MPRLALLVPAVLAPVVAAVISLQPPQPGREQRDVPSQPLGGSERGNRGPLGIGYISDDDYRDGEANGPPHDRA